MIEWLLQIILESEWTPVSDSGQVQIRISETYASGKVYHTFFQEIYYASMSLFRPADPPIRIRTTFNSLIVPMHPT
jgi:hypothetical protein